MTSYHPETLTPTTFLDVAGIAPGWSEQFGGPEGITTLTVALQEQAKAQISQLAVIRASAVAQLLETRSLSEVAAMLGISRAAVSKIARGPRWANPVW